MQWLKKIAPFAISLILLVIIARLAPWPQVLKILAELQLSTIIILIVLSLLYYLLKAIRFWYMLKSININQPLLPVTLSYLSAQPVTLLPAGELYRSKALERYRNVPMRQSVPTFTAQGIFEGLGMALVALAAASTLHIGRVPALILVGVVLTALVLVRLGYITKLTKPLNRIPFINISRSKIQAFSDRNRALVTGEAFLVLSAISLLVEIIGVFVALVSIQGLGGHVNFFQAAIIYIVPIIVSFISFLPGGFGAAEQSSIGILLLMGQGGALAVAATILIRTFIVGSGLVFSALAWALLRIFPKTQVQQRSRKAA